MGSKTESNLDWIHVNILKSDFKSFYHIFLGGLPIHVLYLLDIKGSSA